MNDEQWRPVVGWEDLYRVSDRGRVHSLDRIDALGRLRVGQELTPHPRGKGGRLFVALWRDGQRVQVWVHVLMLEAFIGLRPPGEVGRHLDDIPTHNLITNLTWGTRSDNSFDASRNGRNWQTKKTHCAQGHEYTAENTWIRRDGSRGCRECARINARRQYQKKRGAA